MTERMSKMVSEVIENKENIERLRDADDSYLNNLGEFIDYFQERFGQGKKPSDILDGIQFENNDNKDIGPEIIHGFMSGTDYAAIKIFKKLNNAAEEDKQQYLGVCLDNNIHSLNDFIESDKGRKCNRCGHVISEAQYQRPTALELFIAGENFGL